MDEQLLEIARNIIKLRQLETSEEELALRLKDMLEELL